MEKFLEFAKNIGERVISVWGHIVRIVKSKKFIRYLPLAIVLVIAIISFTTCMSRARTEPDPEPDTSAVEETTPSVTPQEPSPEPDPEPETEPEPDPEPEPEPEPDLGPTNPLTGLPTEIDLSNNRPLAIMINNISAALPQLGISEADILYEMLVEGGITRMLAIFQDATGAGTIGSIRSARPYYVDVAQSYDAIYIHAGGSDQAYSVLSSRDITRLDGVHGRQTQIFYRDPNRSNMAFEHRLVTSGQRIAEFFPTYDFRKVHEDGYVRNLSFVDDGSPAGGSAASEFTVRFSTGKTTSFAYSADDNLYYLSQSMRGYNGPYIDGNDSSQLAFTNVIVLKTSISQIPNDAYHRLRIATTGSGSGYFACGGSYTEINWSRENDSAQFEYTLDDGSALSLGRGRTYICIVPNDFDVDFS